MNKTVNIFKKHRDKLHLSQNKIAEELNTTQGVISKIENGKLYGVYYVKYLKLLSKKGVDLNEFFQNINV